MLNRCLYFLSISLLVAGCSKRPFLPQNVGREDANPRTPIVISHLSADNKWMVKRVKQKHNIFQRILCFKYVCRAQVGRNKPKKGLSQKEYSRVIENNNARGLYEKPFQEMKPAVNQIQKDSALVVPDTLVVSTKRSLIDRQPVKADSLVTLSDFLFETNSFELKQTHVAELDELIDFLLKEPQLRLIISGHTDNTGDESNNLALSDNRAKSVASYLVSHGIKPHRLTHIGLGSSKPIADNRTSSGRSRNRRVEILIRYGQ